MLTKRKRLQILLSAVLVILSLSGLTWINYRFSLQNPGGNDFMTYWNPARYLLLKGFSPYDDRVGLATEELIYGRPADITRGEDLNLFVYPIYSMTFFGPFGALDYLAARTLWMTFLEMAAIALALISLKLSGWKLSPAGLAALLLFSLIWYPEVRTLILGQFSGINALLIVGAILLVQQKRDVTAGVLLALSMSKPQMSFLIIPFTLLWGLSAKRWRLVQSILGSSILLWLLPMLLFPNWPLQWIRELSKYPAYTARIGSIVEIISGVIPGLSQPLSLILYAFFGLFLLREWALAWGKDKRWYLWTALMTLVISNIISPRNATTHYVELLPVPLLLFQFWKENWGIKGEIAAWSILGVLLSGLWALFLLTVQGNAEQAAVYPAFPLACFFGLWWLRSHALGQPAVFLDKIPLTQS
jgi:hypothetical protein